MIPAAAHVAAWHRVDRTRFGCASGSLLDIRNYAVTCKNDASDPGLVFHTVGEDYDERFAVTSHGQPVIFWYWSPRHTVSVEDALKYLEERAE